MYNGNYKVASLVYKYIYVYVCSKTIFSPVIVNEPLSPERIFASSKSFLFKFVISRFLYCKKFSCDEKKNVSVCDRRKPNSCKPKNDFDRDFLARALCTMVIMKLHPLFIYICICMFKNDIFPCAHDDFILWIRLIMSTFCMLLKFMLSIFCVLAIFVILKCLKSACVITVSRLKCTLIILHVYTSV